MARTPGARTGTVTRVAAAGPYVALDDVAPGFEYGPTLDTVGGLTVGDRVIVTALATDPDALVVLGLIGGRAATGGTEPHSHDYAPAAHDHDPPSVTEVLGASANDIGPPFVVLATSDDGSYSFAPLTVDHLPWEELAESVYDDRYRNATRKTGYVASIDTALEPGVYATADGITASASFPAGVASRYGLLRVTLAGSSALLQEYFPHVGTVPVYSRLRYDGTWYSWRP